MIQKDFVEELISDQNYSLGPLNGKLPGTEIPFELSLESPETQIPEELKDILKRIGRDVRSELVDKNFSAFSIVQALIPKSLSTETILSTMLSKYYDLPKKIEKFDSEKVEGWINLFTWCVENKSLFKNFPVITKGGEVIQLDDMNNLSFLMPFRILNIDPEYEKLFPDSRILNPKYFRNAQNFDNLRSTFESYAAFGVRLINGFSMIQISLNRLKAISTDPQDKITTVSHKIYSKEPKISSIPFINDIIGKIGEPREQAKTFLRFCVEVLAKQDKRFVEEIPVTCNCGDH